MALLFGAALWCGSCLVCFLGSGVFFSPVCGWVDILIVTRLVPSGCPRVSACCCLCQGPWPHFCCMQGPRCPPGILSPPCSALFRASYHSTWWWTLLAFVTRDALRTWQTLRYLQDFVFSALSCLVAGLVAWGLCICAWVPGLPAAEELDLCPCWFIIANW